MQKGSFNFKKTITKVAIPQKIIINIKDQIEYIRKNYYGQEYIYFALRELDNVILNNYHKVNDNFVFSKKVVDGLLRAFTFAMQYMQEDLPQHVYNYMDGKSGSFFRQLLEQYKEQKVI